MPDHIRWITRKDIPAVAYLERYSQPNPWHSRRLEACLKRPNCVGQIALRQGKIVAYMIYLIGPEQLTLLRLGVLPECRRHGYGTRLLMRLTAKLTPRREYLECVVSELNLRAQLFLKSRGFVATRVLRDHYKVGKLMRDAYLFQYGAPVLVAQPRSV